MYGCIPGGQAELVRVPKANIGPFKVPGTLADEKVLFLSDILPTAWQAVLNANIGQGSSVAIYGAGPVGLLSAACARMLGTERIFMVDHHAYRLDYAQRTYGVIPINFDDDDDPADTIIRQTPGSRAPQKRYWLRSSSKAVGVKQCASAQPPCGVGGGERTGSVLRVHSRLSIWRRFRQGLTFKMGQTHVQRFLPELLEHIETGRLQPEAIITTGCP
jgi:threonine dehydrogenase-like Zn-dependent dehydrogenase